MRLLRQRRSKVELHRMVARRHPEPYGNLRPHLITVATNPHATMHYDIARCREAAPFEQVDAACQHAGGSATPAGMNERDRSFVRNRKIDGDTIGDSNRQKHPGIAGRMTIDAIKD